MVWEAGAVNAGFSTGTPWLPVPGSHQIRATDIQESAPGSVLSRYRDVLALRKRHPALVQGSIIFLDAADEVLAFVREADGERLLCVFNFAQEAAAWLLPDAAASATLIPLGDGATSLQGKSVMLPPLGAFLARIP
jgi:alpha-glucosidase